MLTTQPRDPEYDRLVAAFPECFSGGEGQPIPLSVLIGLGYFHLAHTSVYDEYRYSHDDMVWGKDPFSSVVWDLFDESHLADETQQVLEEINLPHGFAIVSQKVRTRKTHNVTEWHRPPQNFPLALLEAKQEVGTTFMWNGKCYMILQDARNPSGTVEFFCFILAEDIDLTK